MVNPGKAYAVVTCEPWFADKILHKKSCSMFQGIRRTGRTATLTLLFFKHKHINEDSYSL